MVQAKLAQELSDKLPWSFVSFVDLGSQKMNLTDFVVLLTFSVTQRCQEWGPLTGPDLPYVLFWPT